MPAYKLKICADSRNTCREAETLYAVRKEPETICPHCRGTGECQYALSYCLDGFAAEVWIKCPVPNCLTNCRLTGPDDNPDGEFHRIERDGNLLWRLAKGKSKRSVHITFAPCGLHFHIGANDPPPEYPAAPCCAYPQ